MSSPRKIGPLPSSGLMTFRFPSSREISTNLCTNLDFQRTNEVAWGTRRMPNRIHCPRCDGGIRSAKISRRMGSLDFSNRSSRPDGAHGVRRIAGGLRESQCVLRLFAFGRFVDQLFHFFCLVVHRVLSPNIARICFYMNGGSATLTGFTKEESDGYRHTISGPLLPPKSKPPRTK